MFDVEVLQFSTHARSGQGQWLAEVVATAGLVFVILRAPVGKAFVMVACYIGAAYWFTRQYLICQSCSGFWPHDEQHFRRYPSCGCACVCGCRVPQGPVWACSVIAYWGSLSPQTRLKMTFYCRAFKP
jgi:hypothetical protein